MTDFADVIVDLIIAELTRRKGLDHSWEEIDEDIQDEIKESLARIVRSRSSSKGGVKEVCS